MIGGITRGRISIGHVVEVAPYIVVNSLRNKCMVLPKAKTLQDVIRVSSKLFSNCQSISRTRKSSRSGAIP